jgi:hypothetical protein
MSILITLGRFGEEPFFWLPDLFKENRRSHLKRLSRSRLLSCLYSNVLNYPLVTDSAQEAAAVPCMRRCADPDYDMPVMIDELEEGSKPSRDINTIQYNTTLCAFWLIM